MKKTDIYQIVTDRIVKQMESGVLPWHQPWVGTMAISHESGKQYSCLNQMLLGKGGEWLTHKQIENAGGKVKKGEQSSIVVFWKQMQVEKKQEDGTVEVSSIPVLRYYSVWHIDQVDGVEAKFKKDNAEPVQPIEEAEKVVSDYFGRETVKLHRDNESNSAYYVPSTDEITVPNLSQYAEAAEYYSTLFHEMTHSTGHRSRLNRKEIQEKCFFGDEDYSKEELTA